ncbi:hypothetical protein ABFY41_15990 [Acinetobacter haemolyticus]|uniref:hypothetical protein n=1 Tax=Acinetobacter haemolyticus TaxID=29430 RepID=UPI003D1F0868
MATTILAVITFAATHKAPVKILNTDAQTNAIEFHHELLKQTKLTETLQQIRSTSQPTPLTLRHYIVVVQTVYYLLQLHLIVRRLTKQYSNLPIL